MSPSASMTAMNASGGHSNNSLHSSYGFHSNNSLYSSYGEKPFPRPKLLLLTVSDAPKHDVELQVSVQDDDILNKVGHWAKRLNGVYLQYEKHMLTEHGSHVLRSLREQNLLVGVWGYADRDPDDYNTSRRLVQQGRVNFVNTDLPRDFFQDSVLLSDVN